MHHLTPIPALIGGILIGLSASLLYLTHGKIAGISGILWEAYSKQEPRTARTELFFLAGLIASGVFAGLVVPSLVQSPRAPLVVVAVAGLLVGFGTRLGNGCTSGHGVCGISRMSIRSVVATVTFIAAGGLSVLAYRALGGSP